MPKFSGFVTKTVVPILLPYKIKLLESHAIPKNCPIYFSMIKKMPLNILQQKTTDIHTDWFQQRSVKSLVCFFFLSISPHSKTASWLSLQKHIYTKLYNFHNLDLVWVLKVVSLLQLDPNVNPRLWKRRMWNGNMGSFRGAECENKKKRGVLWSLVLF